MADTATLDAPPAPAPVRPRAVLVGSALAAGASFIGVLALLGIYVARRAEALSSGGSWLPEGSEIPLTPSNMAFGTMLLSGLTIWWAVDAVRKDDRTGAYLAFGLTFLFGFAVINATMFIIKVAEIPVDGVVGTHLYTAVGAHIVMMVAGLLYLATQALRTLAGESGRVNREGITGAALYWTAAVVAHGAIWLAIYIAK